MPDSDTLASVASIIAGFGVAMLFFRIQRELDMGEEGEPIWIPHADWLLISATLVSLLLVILPLVAILSLSSPLIMKLPAAACAAASVMIAGYIFGILAHYRLIFGRNRSGPRENPEPAERFLVRLTVVLAIIIFAAVLLSR